MKKRKSVTVFREVRAAAQADPLGYNGLARKAGLDPAQVWRFAVGERDLTLENFEKLVEALGLTLKRKGRGKS